MIVKSFDDGSKTVTTSTISAPKGNDTFDDFGSRINRLNASSTPDSAATSAISPTSNLEADSEEVPINVMAAGIMVKAMVIITSTITKAWPD